MMRAAPIQYVHVPLSVDSMKQVITAKSIKGFIKLEMQSITMKFQNIVLEKGESKLSKNI